MTRFAVMWLIFLFTAGTACAAESAAALSDHKDGGRCLYLYPHEVSHPVYGKENANDYLRVISKDDDKMTFQMTTIADEYHECLIMGDAQRTGRDSYEYRENSCRLTFVFGPGEVKLAAQGAQGDFCRCADLRAGHGCGYNTLIRSAAYGKEKTKAQAAP